jgi:hypothetical protein
MKSSIEGLSSRFFVLLSAAIFSTPFLLAAYFKCGFVKLANENLAYRYFFHERLSQGEGVFLGVGYLTTLLQAPLYWSTQLFAQIFELNIFQKLNLFAFSSLALFNSLMIGLAILACLSKVLANTDRIALAVLIFASVLGSRYVGFDYYLMAEYYLCNMLLYAVHLFLFLFNFRKSPDKISLIALGIICGLSIANRITLLPFCLFCASPSIFNGAISFYTILKRVFIYSSLSALAFLLAHLLVFMGKASLCSKAIKLWFNFTRNPGTPLGAIDFLGVFSFVGKYLYHEFYAQTALIIVCVLILILSCVPSTKSILRQIRPYLILGFIIGTSYLFFVLKYPAVSSLFDASMVWLSLALGLTSICLRQAKAGYVAMVFVCLCGLLLGYMKLDKQGLCETLVKRSGPNETLAIQNFNAIRSIAGDLPCIVVFPGNEYHHEGVFELLLKASSDFPMWQIGRGRETVLKKYFPNLSFRHAVESYGGPSPDLPYPGNCALVWFSSPDFQDLPDRYPIMKEAVARAVSIQTFSEYPKEGKPEFKIHAALLNTTISPPR